MGEALRSHVVRVREVLQRIQGSHVERDDACVMHNRELINALNHTASNTHTRKRAAHTPTQAHTITHNAPKSVVLPSSPTSTSLTT